MARVEVTMPKMGESITEGTVIAWHKQPGDAVEEDETLLEIGTDKVDTEVPSPAEGVLQEILVQEGDTVDVGTVIAVLDTEAEAGGDTAPADGPSADADVEPAAEEPAEAGEPAEAEAPQEEAPAVEVAAQEMAGGSSAPSGGATVDVVMPKMGESIMEGTILTWHKQPGDAVELDETLLEIATDKVDTEVPSPAAGTVQEVLVEEGETVDVGTRIAVIATGEPAAAGSEAPTPEPSAAPAPASSEASGDGVSANGAQQEAEAIPRKGTDGQFFSPLVRSIAEKEGLSQDELETIQGSGREGRVTKEDVLRYVEGRGAQPSAAPPAPTPSPAARATPERSTAPAPARTATSSEAGGRVEIVEMDRMRQIIADHMVRSKATSAHVTSFAEADVTNLVRLREKNKEAFFEREGVKLTFTPFFAQAAIEALREHPLLNASVEDRRILVKKDLHVGIAVAIGKTGLVAPIIRDAGEKNLVGLAKAAADLAERARAKQLQPDEIQGGTFTVTNIGSLGSLMGTPIINQPQVAILATGAIKKRPVVVEHPDLGDLIAVRHMMYLSLSYDHRIIDGAMGASFLQSVVRWLEELDPEGDV